MAILVAVCAAAAWPGGSMVAAQPGMVATGDLGWIRVFAVAQVVAFALFAVAVFMVRRSTLSTAAVMVLATVIQLLPLVAPLMLSADAWSYWNAGRMSLVSGGNPYVDVPLAFPADPSFPYTGNIWRDATTPYGPVFTLGSEGVAIVAGVDASTAAWLYKAAAGFLMVALTFLVAKVALRPAFAAAFVGWNPVFAMQFAGSGHNDVLMTTLVIGGLMLGSSRYARGAGVAWSVAIFVKWLPLILLPLQLLEDHARRRRSILFGFAVASLILAGISTIAFGLEWVGSFGLVFDNATDETFRSLAIWPRLLGSFLPRTLVTIMPLMLFGVAYVLLLREAARGRARHGLTIGLFLLASPFLWTWYLVSPAALSAAEDDLPGLWLAFALCAYCGLYYLGDVGTALEVFGSG